MSDYCIVVADATRARFFTLEAADIPGLESGPNLIEHNDLVNAETLGSGRDTWTEAKSGRNTAPRGGPAHGYDDHRDQHEDEFVRRFAKDIATDALRNIQQHKAGNLVLVAASRMLGFLRDAVDIPAGAKIEVREAPKDLIRLNANDIHEHLGNAGLLPQRRRATSQF